MCWKVTVVMIPPNYYGNTVKLPDCPTEHQTRQLKDRIWEKQNISVGVNVKLDYIDETGTI